MTAAGGADAEEQHQRQQVGERRQRLHHVEHRRDDRPRPRRCAPSATASGSPIATERHDRQAGDDQQVHAVLVEAEQREQQRSRRPVSSDIRQPATSGGEEPGERSRARRGSRSPGTGLGNAGALISSWSHWITASRTFGDPVRDRENQLPAGSDDGRWPGRPSQVCDADLVGTADTSVSLPWNATQPTTQTTMIAGHQPEPRMRGRAGRGRRLLLGGGFGRPVLLDSAVMTSPIPGPPPRRRRPAGWPRRRRCRRTRRPR